MPAALAHCRARPVGRFEVSSFGMREGRVFSCKSPVHAFGGEPFLPAPDAGLGFAGLARDAFVQTPSGLCHGNGSASRCHSAWGPNADRRGNSLNSSEKGGGHTLSAAHSRRAVRVCPKRRCAVSRIVCGGFVKRAPMLAPRVVEADELFQPDRRRRALKGVRPASA